MKLKQHFPDEKTGIEYTLHGDYYLPDISLPAEEEKTIGIWGQRHLRYIRQYNKRLYLDLCMSGKLNNYLVEIDAQAEDFFLRTVKEMAAREGLTESLKAKDQMRWVGLMNNIHRSATEIVNQQIIYN